MELTKDGYPKNWDDVQTSEPKLQALKKQQEQELRRELEVTESTRNILTYQIGEKRKELRQLGIDVENIFPYEVFPVLIQQLVDGLKHELKLDWCYSMILGTISVAIGNTLNVKVRNGYVTGTPLYIANVGGIGTGKTPVQKWFIEPLRKLEKQHRVKYEQAYRDYERNGATGTKPKFQQIILNDVTTEALPTAFDNNKRGVLLSVDELIQWVRNMYRYGGTNGGTYWLSLYNQEPLTVNRKSVKNEYIEKPFCTVIGGIQPMKVKELFADDRNENGFIPRILFAYPRNNETPQRNRKQIESKWEMIWENIVQSIYSIPLSVDDISTPVPYVVPLSKEAQQIFDNWEYENICYTDVLDDTDVQKSIYVKYANHLPRIALIIEVLEQCVKPNFRTQHNTYTPFEISGNTMLGAVKVLEYYRTNLVELSKQNTTKPVSTIEQQIDHLSNDLLGLYQDLQGKFTLQQAYTIGEPYGLSKRQIQYFVSKKKLLFRPHGNGRYSKIEQNE